MKVAGKTKVLFIAGFGPVVRDTATSRNLYREALGIFSKRRAAGIFIPQLFKAQKPSPCGTLSQAAHSCFGNDSWPAHIPVPQAWLEFDVDSVENATADLESQGRILVKNKKEPWDQTVTRLLSPEGLLVGLTFTPSMRKEQ